MKTQQKFAVSGSQAKPCLLQTPTCVKPVSQPREEKKIRKTLEGRRMNGFKSIEDEKREKGMEHLLTCAILELTAP